MKTAVSVYEAKANLSRLIAEVLRTGRPITICRNREPVVDLVAHQRPGNPLKTDPSLKGAVFHQDPCAPVDREDWPEDLR